MLIYKQRYKPRTTREFTKSDLTVYDSAGNTALNALTVYGKSEVVNDEIISAGEGYAVVDISTLTWTYQSSQQWFASLSLNSVIKKPVDNKDICRIVTPKYETVSRTNIGNKKICVNTTGNIIIQDTDFSDVTDFVNSLSDIMLVYPLADPTQGNCIAVKTDDGSGINGTMATFTTGTPLRGIPDSNVRDVMAWDGSSGEITKNCTKARLADLTWTATSAGSIFYAVAPNASTPIPGGRPAISSKYTQFHGTGAEMGNKTFIFNNSSQSSVTGIIYIKDEDYTTVSDFLASLGDAELVYELATPTTEQLTTAENASIAGLRTFEPQTHAQNNAQTEMTVDYTIRVPTI